MKYIGIDIGGTKTAVVVGNDKGEILKKTRFDTPKVNEALKNICDIIDAESDFCSIGISCGGPLDSKKGIIQSPPNLPGWDDIHITDMLTKRYGVPAYLCNDANACALAEWKFGAGKGCDNMIFLTFGTGLGAGLILDGKLYEGTNGMAGEAGHIRLSPFGGVGYGKAGSFESFCSGGGIAQLARTRALELFQQGKKAAFCQNPDEINGITAKTVAEYAVNGDSDALEIFRICGEKLGEGLSVLVDILNPQRIVIGSIFARCEQLLRPHAQRVMERECLAVSLGVCELVPAQLGESIGDMAALAVAVSHIN
ncbi:MAG: ROK family protein [Ruminococcaceae bacterium]|nr:ROK family protein [Oscillospiraceae bacterium]